MHDFLDLFSEDAPGAEQPSRAPLIWGLIVLAAIVLFFVLTFTLK